MGAPAATVEASGFICAISGTSVAAAPSTPAAPVATKRKSRRVGSAADMVVTVFGSFPSRVSPGPLLRLAACRGLEAHLMEPAGFPVSDRAFRRAGMDYLDQVSLTRHPSWPDFERWRVAHGLRLVLFTTKAAASYLDHRYEERDILLFGRESSGVPDHVREAAEVRLRIPMHSAR